MLKGIFSIRTLYFNYEYNLSNPFDKVMGNNSQFNAQQKTSEGLYYYRIPNHSFFLYIIWNTSNLNQFQTTNLPAFQYWQNIFIIKCVLIRYCKLNQQSDGFLIFVSRRETLRSGRKFMQRGCIQDRNCTNFAENQSILILNRQESKDIYSLLDQRINAILFLIITNLKLTIIIKLFIQNTLILDRSCNNQLHESLDRTNIVQSVVSRNFLLNILNQANVIHTLTGEGLKVLPNELEQIFREKWSKQCRYIKFLIQRNWALKTDYTRVGKRTFLGFFQMAKMHNIDIILIILLKLIFKQYYIKIIELHLFDIKKIKGGQN
ncbi:unnamed protein product (macronuclear) [Paramecium tetraurelia]|uniref:SAC domain-containing protein n=1 Tax=Paramecium tetraurelia TaxID=5888 RepID=A0D5R6_PARTE|nr:uncharacterized protein GSPATT00013813001 [Paramecium tetraurelia]CAK78383.1 unnamed protein product [Paramecium tetraurelia]|eukprot:XP_001445780.1 hypothetical protein (macronuclear) [Paramecium tetraurelia strain d4-2]